jgi:hypothetical protein
MVEIKDGNIDLKALRNLYQSDKVARAFLDYAARRQRNAVETPVDRVRMNLRHEGCAASRKDTIELFRKLADIGCGEFVVGRRGRESRFLWSVGLVSVGRAASGESEEIERITEDDSSDDETSDTLTHRFHLRPDNTVEFDLPTNLTESEANRLADYIRTLPFRA